MTGAVVSAVVIVAVAAAVIVIIWQLLARRHTNWRTSRVPHSGHGASTAENRGDSR